jgi:hypothetical protein
MQPSQISITEAGHSAAHFPHPIHLLLSTIAYIPLAMVIALFGQTLAQHPQATQSFSNTTAYFLRFFVACIDFPPIITG